MVISRCTRLLPRGPSVVAIPETLTDFPAIVGSLHVLKQRGKTSITMIVAEGDEMGVLRESTNS